MAKHKVAVTAAKLDRALEQAAKREDEPRLIEAEYRPGAGLDLLILKLSDGRRQLIPREDLQGLDAATPEQIAHMEVLGNGTGLRWPQLSLDHYVPSLLRHVYGTRRWMAEIGRSGGAARSAAKRRSSQANGRKGGRPKQNGLLSSP
jgi:Protein of unknown function (DUF2442)